MRTIKFTAKSFDGEWVFGDLHLNCKFPHIHTKERRSIPIDPTTIGQFTGLVDRNGVYIYEGDIVKVELGEYDKVGRLYVKDLPKFLNGVVTYKSAKFGIEFPYENKHHICGCEIGCGNECLEVVGNIHDNKDLLNEAASSEERD